MTDFGYSLNNTHGPDARLQWTADAPRKLWSMGYFPVPRIHIDPHDPCGCLLGTWACLLPDIFPRQHDRDERLGHYCVRNNNELRPIN